VAIFVLSIEDAQFKLFSNSNVMLFRYILPLLFSVAGVLTAAAQPKARYLTPKVEMGNIAWKVPALAHFEIRNTGTQPLLVTGVYTDCACTVAAWDKQPIAPGATTTLTVTLDAETLGTFDKSVYVTTNAENVARRLRFSGRVMQKVIDYDRDFAYKIGDIRLSADHIEFDDVKKGEKPQVTLFLLNAGKKEYKPELLHLPNYLTAKADPAVLRPGKMGKLVVTLKSNQLHGLGLTQSSVYLSRFAGDRVNKDNELGISVTLLPNFTAAELNSPQAPLAEMATSIDLGAFNGKSKLKGTVVLTNKGQSPLVINMLQVYNPGISVALSKTTLRPGESTDMKIVVSSAVERFRGSRKVLLITNDPRHPKISLDVITKK
jgi:hypothetical protein